MKSTCGALARQLEKDRRVEGDNWTAQAHYDAQQNRCLGRFTIDANLHDGTSTYDEFVVDLQSGKRLANCGRTGTAGNEVCSLGAKTDIVPTGQVRTYIDSLMRDAE